MHTEEYVGVFWPFAAKLALLATFVQNFDFDIYEGMIKKSMWTPHLEVAWVVYFSKLILSKFKDNEECWFWSRIAINEAKWIIWMINRNDNHFWDRNDYIIPQK